MALLAGPLSLADAAGEELDASHQTRVFAELSELAPDVRLRVAAARAADNALAAETARSAWDGRVQRLFPRGARVSGWTCRFESLARIDSAGGDQPPMACRLTPLPPLNTRSLVTLTSVILLPEPLPENVRSFLSGLRRGDLLSAGWTVVEASSDLGYEGQAVVRVSGEALDAGPAVPPYSPASSVVAPPEMRSAVKALLGGLHVLGRALLEHLLASPEASAVVRSGVRLMELSVTELGCVLPPRRASAEGADSAASLHAFVLALSHDFEELAGHHVAAIGMPPVSLSRVEDLALRAKERTAALLSVGGASGGSDAIEVSDPASGTMIEVGRPLVVRGSVRTHVPGATILINGEPVALAPDGGFEASLRVPGALIGIDGRVADLVAPWELTVRVPRASGRDVSASRVLLLVDRGPPRAHFDLISAGPAPGRRDVQVYRPSVDGLTARLGWLLDDIRGRTRLGREAPHAASTEVSEALSRVFLRSAWLTRTLLEADLLLSRVGSLHVEGVVVGVPPCGLIVNGRRYALAADGRFDIDVDASWRSLPELGFSREQFDYALRDGASGGFSPDRVYGSFLDQLGEIFRIPRPSWPDEFAFGRVEMVVQDARGGTASALTIDVLAPSPDALVPLGLPTASRARAVFDAIDRDGSRLIEREELAEAFRGTISWGDKDRNGALSPAEFESFLRVVVRQGRRADELGAGSPPAAAPRVVSPHVPSPHNHEPPVAPTNDFPRQFTPSDAVVADLCRAYFDRLATRAGTGTMASVDRVRIERFGDRSATAHIAYHERSSAGAGGGERLDSRMFGLELQQGMWVVVSMGSSGSGRFPDRASGGGTSCGAGR
ncbi:MAG: EF-hand domain-containing protein [Planctomycetes bacterium]|nr:EF-hand domain-containing protein [Planctomycetota bacterium]